MIINRIKYIFLLGLFFILLPFLSRSQGVSPSFQHKTLLVFFDGLRPDYITEQHMPHLYAFRQKASLGRHHHSVFPTVTRVNAASYATGSYPGTHGILGNTVYFPQVNPTHAVGTSHGDLMKISQAVGGDLLTGISLGEVLRQHGQRMMVFSSGTTGQAFLQNHTVGDGAIVNPDLILPESFRPTLLAELGPVQTGGDEEENRHRWITDAYLNYGLDEQGPLVSAIWYSDPDGAAHSHGIGSPEALKAIHFVDAQFGRILEKLETRGLTNRVNILISADHGFVTHVGKQNLTDFLIAQGLKRSKDSEDVVVAEGAVYVKDHTPDQIKKIVEALHREEWVGAVFTRSPKKGSDKGWVPGTLSFEAIHYQHPDRTGDILVATNWKDDKNQRDIAGTGYATGVAGHGGSSPYEIHIALMAQGPDFGAGVQDELPTSNVDIAPTVLSFYGIPVPEKMDGRVLSELRKGHSEKNKKFKKEIVRTEATYAWGTYRLELERSVLGTYRYVNFTKVQRDVKK